MDDDIKSMNKAAKALLINIGFSLSSILDQENINTDIFITFFEIIHLAMIIIMNLANHFFDYIITGSNLDLKYYESGLFIYINLERYTSAEFYEIMMDIGASK